MTAPETPTVSSKQALTQLKTFLQTHLPPRILCQRIFKSTISTTISLILCLNPTSLSHLGGQPGMLPLISVIVHPGRRVGTMFEATMFCVSGLLLGNSYALFSRFIAQRILGSDMLGLTDVEQLTLNYSNYRAALAWLCVMQVLMLFFHGWMRSITHKFFAIVFPVFLVVHFAFSDNLHTDAATIVENYTVPFFVGIALSWACNLLIFPEFGSTYLGKSVTESLNELHYTVDSTVQFFITLNDDDKQELVYLKKPSTLAQLTKLKTSLRSKLNTTQAVLQECLYEISISRMSPLQLKPLILLFKSQLPSVSALINACQLELTMLLQRQTHSELLKDVLNRTKKPIFDLQRVMSQSLYVTKLAIAHSYDVNLSKATASTVIANEPIEHSQQVIDKQIEALAQAMAVFEVTYREELQHLSLSSSSNSNGSAENISKAAIDHLSPNDDMFLLSSFLMNLKETANTICNMLRQTSSIYRTRINREKKWLYGYRVWFSFLTNTQQLKGWFIANSNDNVIKGRDNISLNGGGADAATVNGVTSGSVKVFIKESEPEVKQHQTNNSTEKVLDPSPPKRHSISERISRQYFQTIRKYYSFQQSHRDHFRFGFQIAIGLTLATFPMFVPQSRHWFYDLRGTWIGFVCILVLEPQMGGTFFVFFLRFVGVISGAAWGYLSYVCGGKHQTMRWLQVLITVVYAIPGYYYFLGTPYVKAAIIGVISVYVVMLSAILPSSIEGGILVNFGKRCLAMIYGGAVALVCQLIFFPVKARDELASEVSKSLGNLSKLVLLYATGLEGGEDEDEEEEDKRSEAAGLVMTERRFDKFQQLSGATRASLIKADAFRHEAMREPRLKGSFKEGSKIFGEIIFILREILDRLDNIILLRRTYGSAIIEKYNKEVHPYRRQVTASMNSCFKAVELALITKNPLPQYLPSPKIAHERLIEKIRKILSAKIPSTKAMKRGRSSNSSNSSDFSDSDSESDLELNINFHDRSRMKHQSHLLKTQYLSWNATTASLEEIIQYIEELMELSKLLVGVYHFKYGFLSRSIYEDYAKDTDLKFNNLNKAKINMERGLSQAVPLSEQLIQEEAEEIGMIDDLLAMDSTTQANTLQNAAATVSTNANGIDTDDEDDEDGEDQTQDQNPTAFFKDSLSTDNDDTQSIKTTSTSRSFSRGFRKRLYSVGSFSGALGRNNYDMGDLTSVKSRDLGMDGLETESDEMEDDMPMVLKRVVSRKINEKSKENENEKD